MVSGIRKNKQKQEYKKLIHNLNQEDFIFLVRSLGGVAYERIKKDKYYDISFRLPPEMVPVTLPRKFKRYKKRIIKYNPYRAIKEVIPWGEKECVCISVSSLDGTYITDNFIVTHNTKIIIDIINYRMNLECSVGSALVVAPSVYSVTGWANEIKKHSNLTCTILYGNVGERFDGLQADTDIYVINYQGLPTIVCDMVDKVRKGELVMKGNRVVRENAIINKRVKVFSSLSLSRMWLIEPMSSFPILSSSFLNCFSMSFNDFSASFIIFSDFSFSPFLEV